jgi:hypothetical protein
MAVRYALNLGVVLPVVDNYDFSATCLERLERVKAPLQFLEASNRADDDAHLSCQFASGFHRFFLCNPRDCPGVSGRPIR